MPNGVAPALLSQLESAAKQIADDLGLDLVVLFGSTARGDRPHPEDLDLALRGPAPLDLIDATNRVTVALSRDDVDLVDLRRADPLLLMLVARDGIPLFDRSGSEFNSFRSLAARRYADTAKFREAEKQYLRDFIAGRVATR